MVGLFDSGSGGLNTVRYIREAVDVDLVYLIDRENAPYGIKTKKELVRITERNIRRLLDMGAERVLIACCTASTVYKSIGKEYREKAIPIIEAVANTAKYSTRSGRIGVIATKRTVDSHAFSRALPGCKTYELSLGELVGMIDSGLSDETVTEADEVRLEKMLKPVLAKNIDTLILGCTHFPSLKETARKIASRYGVTSIVDSARVGADLLIEASEKLNLNG
ncbi:MAG: aspartate/glutamate racemase family protein [Clostridia bacterium]|nr:aspartate/glutamate racemase family protein [Clostridia bacterium]